MTIQYSLFDTVEADRKRDLDIALGRPPDILPRRYGPTCRGPAPSKRFFKVGMVNGTSIIVETALSMFELSNELRGKAKVTLTLADGRSVEVKSLDVAYLENVYRVRV